MKLYFLSNHQSNLKSKSSSLRLFLSFRLIFNTISREREQFSNIFLFLINNFLLSFSFLFFPPPPFLSIRSLSQRSELEEISRGDRPLKTRLSKIGAF